MGFKKIQNEDGVIFEKGRMGGGVIYHHLPVKILKFLLGDLIFLADGEISLLR